MHAYYSVQCETINDEMKKLDAYARDENRM